MPRNLAEARVELAEMRSAVAREQSSWATLKR